MSADKQTRSRKPRQSRSDFRRLSRRFMGGLLRSLFLINQRTRRTQSGFVLPTTVLLLLMVTLTAGALSFRSFSRTQSVIAQREQEVIVGAATPAVDRAKAKIEYLFARDNRFPGGLPTSNKLQAMMRNVENLEAGGSNNAPIPGTDENSPPYTLPDETRLNINNDTALDNAWSFRSDIDGNGTVEDNEIIIYSIIMDDAQEIPAGDPDDPADVRDINDPVNQEKANALVNRNAPIDTATAGNNCPAVGAATASNTQRGTNSVGWESLDNVNLLKNFQIDVFVVNDNAVNRTISALEFQQVRQAVRGNKWGAWFRNDLEIFPGPAFTWNGAMHTEGSVFLGNRPNLNLISAYASCLYPDPSASEITLTSNTDGTFQGQFVTGKLGEAKGTESGYGPREPNNNKPKVDWSNGVGNNRGEETLDETNDSVDEASDSVVSDVALDPIQIFTADVSVHRNASTWTRWADWNTSPLTNNLGNSNARVIDEPNSNIPFLDDLYRADNRYGPKPAYNARVRLDTANGGNGVSVGTTIPDAERALVEPNNGLDGYWERQAINEGLRIIGGQRLELGNATIWKGVDTSDPNFMDPLYPYNRENSRYGGGSLIPSAIRNTSDQSIRQHRLSLRDNLAAVQSMAVYHATGPDGGNFPLMCMSMTSHPGTRKTISRSTAFNNVSINGTTVRDVDFFNGFGTDGWEYGPPLANESDFETAYDTDGSALRKSLRNLAAFAGDPLGGAPSFTPVQDEHIHPYPTMSMWGDYSHLRKLLDAGAPDNLSAVDYAELSPADQSYLHTAACTLGMLAHNIDAINDFTFSESELNALAAEIGVVSVPDVSDPKRTNHPKFSNDFSLPTSPHAYVSTLQTFADQPGATTAQIQIAQLARIFHLKYQIKRDREYGFTKSSRTYTVGTNPIVLDDNNTIPNGRELLLGIDPGDNYGLPTNASEETYLRLAALAGGLDMSSSTQKNAGNPQFPSLFYLFPTTSHDHTGTTSGSVAQPPGDPYVNDGVDTDGDGIGDDSYVQTKNSGFTYNGFTYNALTDTEINTIKLAPKATGDWISPLATPDANSSNTITVAGVSKSTIFLDKGYMDGRELINSRVIDIDVKLATTDPITTGGTNTWIAPNSPTTTGGIVYAFREDAKREDAIVRPIRGYNAADDEATRTTKAEAAWTACAANLISTDCLMRLDIANAFDPPLRRTDGADNSYISPKPVDYFADPARRPYGFRLSNGKTLNRTPAVSAGLSFVTDNVVQIKGDFNLHNNASAVEKQEFTQLLAPDADGVFTDNNFYVTRTTKSTDFANRLLNNDTWRPVEIVGDAVIIVSDNFADGQVSDAFTMPRATVDGGGSSSYQNYLRPRGSSTNGRRTLPVFIRTPSLFRENPYDGHTPVTSTYTPQVGGTDATVTPVVDAAVTAENNSASSNYSVTSPSRGDAIASPVRIWRDGDFRGEEDSITGDTMTLAQSDLIGLRRRDMISARTTSVNALMITGVIPSRGGQSNGGLHNHPRFLEWWEVDDVFMKISGGFFQLNYSTSATAPYDQKYNVWEPTTDEPAGGEKLPYYGAPARVWGYDVALQFVPAGPVANRFITISAPRSEYYQEVAADDPYIRNLQCAVGDLDGDGTPEPVITNRTVTCP